MSENIYESTQKLTQHVLVFILFFIFTLVQIIPDIYARPQAPNIGNRCPSTGIPQGSKRGINVLHGSKPVFKIDVGELGKHGYLPGTQYEGMIVLINCATTCQL